MGSSAQQEYEWKSEVINGDIVEMVSETHEKLEGSRESAYLRQVNF